MKRRDDDVLSFVEKCDVGCWMLDVGCWMLYVVCWILDVGFWMLALFCVL
jgi:hypothetical protein